MTVRVRLFAVVRERVGVSSLELELPGGSTVAAARRALADRFPALADLLPACAFAVNQAYVKLGSPLSDGDELALIPPVSGG